MSNRNFDSRVIIQRLKDQNQAQSVYNNEVNGIGVIRNPQNSNSSPEVILNYKAGAQNAYSKGLLGGLVTENLGGTANFFAGSLDLPSAPLNLVPTVTTTPPAQVSIAFTPGSAGTYPITNYAYSIDGGATYVRVSPPQTTSPVVITGLTVGATYTIFLRAISAAGLGAISAPLTLVVANVPTAPLLISRSIVAGNQQVQVPFTQGDNGGAPITNYFYSVDNGVSFGLFSPAQTTSPVTITGLTNNTTYQVIMKAVNVVGSSVLSNAVSAHTYTSPNTPASLSSTPGLGSVQIAFAQSAGLYAGPITNYQYSTDNGVSFTAFSPAQTTSPVTISGLANSTTYQVALKAVNVAGVSAASSIVSATTAGSPSAPTALSATPGNQQVTIAFTPGADGGSPITNYQYSTDNGATFTAFSPADTTSPVVITGLTNGTTYNIKLMAINIVATSIASSTVTAVPGAFPAAPTITSLVGGNQAIYVLYTAGSDGGSPLTNYQYSTDNGTSFTAFSPVQLGNPLIISGVTNGTSYSVMIQAINANGSGASSNMVTVTPQVNTLSTANLLIDMDAGNAASYPGSGSTWTNLESSGSYSGTLENGPTYSSNNGGYLTFNGTNQVNTIADTAAIRATTSQYITAQVWARVRSSYNGGDGIVGKQYWSPTYDGYSLSLGGTNSVYLKMNGSSVDGTYGSANNVFSTEVWTLFTAVVCFGGRTSNPSYVYINPARVATGNNAESGIPSNTCPLQFPRGINDGNGNFAPADVGQIFYYNTNLSQETIIRNYDATKARYGL